MRVIALVLASLATTDARKDHIQTYSHDVLDRTLASQPKDDFEKSDKSDSVASAASKLLLAAFHLALSSSKVGKQNKARLLSRRPFAQPQVPRRVHALTSASMSASDDEIMELELRLDQMKKDRRRAEQKDAVLSRRTPLKEEDIENAKCKLDEIARDTKDMYLLSTPDENQSSYLDQKTALKKKWDELERITGLPNFRQWYERREAQNDINGAPHRLYRTAGAVYELVYLKREIRNLEDDIKTMTKKREETPSWHWARKKRDSWDYRQQVELVEREVKTKEEEKVHLEEWLTDALDDIFKFFRDGLDDTKFLEQRMQLEGSYDNNVRDQLEKTVKQKRWETPTEKGGAS